VEAVGDVIKVCWGDEIKLKGILADGFGIVPKFAMCDPDLHIFSKAIYAFLCSMVGNGTSAFPGRETMRSRLGISKDSYYKYMDILKDKKYISVEQTERKKGQFPHNTYYLEDNPLPFQEAVKARAPYAQQVTIAFTGIKGAGYGVISRAVMFDDRISAKAKAIYAYIASYSGGDTVKFPLQKVILYHLGMNKETFRNYLEELTSLNLINVVYPHENGHLTPCRFILVDRPTDSLGKSLYEESLVKTVVTGLPETKDASESIEAQWVDQQSKKQDTAKKKRKSNLPTGKGGHQSKKQDTAQQDTVLQDTGGQDTDQQDTEIQDTNSTYLNNTNLNNIFSLEDNQPDTNSLIQEVEKMSFDSVKRKIITLVNFPYAVPNTHLSIYIYDAIVCVADEISKHKPYIRINRENVPWEKAATFLLSLRIEDYLSAVDDILQEPREINNVSAYYITALYNARIAALHKQNREEELIDKRPAVGNE